MSRLVPSLRMRTVLLAAIFGFTTFFVSTAPAETPLPRPEALSPRPAQAMACADGPSFEGRLTASSSSTTAITRSTTGNVFGYLSNVVDDWSCTAWYRYDGLVWARNDGELDGNFDWGNLINSTSVACNWVIGSTDYLKANGTTDCPDSDAEYAMPIYLANTSDGTLLETVFHNDITPDEPGDFGFIHSDCETYYLAESIRYNRPFTPSDPETRPGNNCDPYVHESTNTDQDIVVDGTPPTLNFDWPDEAAAFTAIPSAFAGVVFDATDAVAGFDATHTWSLQRQKATWSGSVCGTFSADGAPTTGVTSANNQVGSQGLADNTCYQWALTATDANGNVRPAITSGRVRTSLTGNLGRQQQHTLEDWDLGGGDTLSVNVGTGNLVLSHPVLSLPIRGSSVELTLTYNRHDASNVGMGPGWRIDILRRLSINADQSVTFTAADGSRHTFTAPVVNGSLTTYTPPATLYGSLVKDTTQTAHEFTLTYRDRSKDRFDISGSSGLLVREEDRFGNGVTMPASATPATITDTAGSRTINLGWTSGKLTSITDWVNVSGGVIQPGGAGNRVHRFFYDGAGALIGWAEPLNTSALCTAGQPSPGSYVTCLKDLGGSLEVSKTQTVSVLDTAPNPDAIGSSSRVITTIVGFANADVTTVRDAEDVALGRPGTDLRHTDSFQTQVTRRGEGTFSHDTITRYKLVAGNDPYARNGIIVRRATIGPDTWLRTDTAWHASFPLEVASLTEDVGGLARTTTNTWAAGTIGPNLTRTVEPLHGTDARWTEHTYNANQDITQTKVSRNGSSTPGEFTLTRSCYNPTLSACGTGDADLRLYGTIENFTGTGLPGANAHFENIIVDYAVDQYGQRTGETRFYHVQGGTLLYGQGITSTFEYDTYGNVIKAIANRVDGQVTGGDDVHPSATTNARTDLTTVHGHDTAGNRISSADPRRPIAPLLTPPVTLVADDYVSRWTFDPLGRRLSETTPTTPGVTITCEPSNPNCRTSSTVYDELGTVRTTRDFGNLLSATRSDRAGRAVETYEDPPDLDGVKPAVRTSISTYDPSGRPLTSEDQVQAQNPLLTDGLGYTAHAYDPLGRQVAVADGVGTGADTETVTGWDSLGREVSVESGVSGTYGGTQAAQKTTTTYDLADRALTVSDEFTCTTTTYDWRDFATKTVEAQTCGGAALREITHTPDGLARLVKSEVTAGTGIGDKPTQQTFDSAGRVLTSAATASGTTTTVTSTHNPLSQVVAEARTDGSLATTAFDPAGNATDRCYWAVDPTPDPRCRPVGTSFAPDPVPTRHSSTTFDARNNRIRLVDASTNAVTIYDPDHNYQPEAIYLPTKMNGASVDVELQSTFDYDERHRLKTLTHLRCTRAQPTSQTDHSCSSTSPAGSAAYGYDLNDNRTQVVEDNGSGGTIRNYCHDSLDRLAFRNTTAACSSSAWDEKYVQDDAGNVTEFDTASAANVKFGYNAQGHLCKVAAASSTDCASGTVAYDAAGRTSRHGGWWYAYDADGRLIRACETSNCDPSADKVEMTYDAEGRRTKVISDPAGAPVATTREFRYQGNAVVEELVGGTSARSYLVDDSGSIVSMVVPSGANAGTYVVTWNGHGDAQALWRVRTDGANAGTLELANSWTYETWGRPQPTYTHTNSATSAAYGDLGFRFLYVGEFDVQWDDMLGMDLLYMHARHYHPSTGRFLQPDPDRSEANLYAYAQGNPVTEIDPDGTCFILCIILVPLVVGAIIDATTYAATTEGATIEGALGEVAAGAAMSLLPVGKLAKAKKVVDAAGKILSKVPKAARQYNKVRKARPDALVRLASQRVARRGAASLERNFSAAQHRAARRHPNLRSAYRGTQFHDDVAREVGGISRGRITYSRRGPDFTDRRTGSRIELTTKRQLSRHYARPGYGRPSPGMRYVSYRLP